MEQNITLIAACLHIREAAQLLAGYDAQLCETLRQLANCIQNEHHLNVSDIQAVSDIAKEIDNG